MQSIIIEPRFCGPSDSGNGGYVCGVLAGLVGDSVEVTLWKPPPLETPLMVEQGKDNVIRLWHHAEQSKSKVLLSEARSTEFVLDIPTPPNYADAQEASKGYVGFHEHPFPDCFVCGTARNIGDGLCIFPGPVEHSSLVAAPWVPDASLVDERGIVKTEFIWAALDCPGAFAALAWSGVSRPALLGRFTAKVNADVGLGERCVAIGWSIDKDRRKYFTGTALFNESGDLLGAAKAIWIEPKP